MRNNRRNVVVSNARKAHWPPSKRRLRELVEDGVVDAYTDSEQRTGLFTMIEDHLALPFDTELLGVTVNQQLGV